MRNKYSVFLRGFNPEDYILINKWRNDRDIQSLTGGTFRYVPLEMEKEWVTRKMMDNVRDIYLAICLNENPELMVGYTSINNIDYIHRSAHGGGIVVGDKNYRDGIIRFEASCLVREHVFEDMNLHRFSAACLSEHLVSRITIEASGFTLEGTKRDAIYKNGKYHDLLQYSLLKEEYELLKNNNAYSIRNYVRNVQLLKKKYLNKKEDGYGNE